MARKTLTKNETRALFAKTGNQCAFPVCDQPIIDQDDVYIGEICHIEALNAGGARYNPKMTDDERHSVENLIVLCRIHHAIVDKKAIHYTVSKLKQMKADHENQFANHPYMIPDRVLEQIIEEQWQFQSQVQRDNENWRNQFDMAMKLELSDEPRTHLDELLESVFRMEWLLEQIREYFDSLPNEIEEFFCSLGYDLTKYREVPYYKNPFYNAFWVFTHIGLRNYMTFIRFHSKALELYLEFQNLKTVPDDPLIREKVDNLKSELLNLASTSMHAD